MRKVIVVSLLLTGCAARPSHVVVPRHCLVSVSLTDKTECTESPDGKYLNCSHLQLERIKGCEIVRVKQ